MKKEVFNKQGQKLSFESANGVLTVSIFDGAKTTSFDVPNTGCAALYEDFHKVAHDVIRQPLTEEQQRAISERWGGERSDKQPF